MIQLNRMQLYKLQKKKGKWPITLNFAQCFSIMHSIFILENKRNSADKIHITKTEESPFTEKLQFHRSTLWQQEHVWKAGKRYLKNTQDRMSELLFCLKKFHLKILFPQETKNITDTQPCNASNLMSSASFEALHVQVSMFIQCTVTPFVFIYFALQVCSSRTCVAEYSTAAEQSLEYGRLLSSKKTMLIEYYLEGKEIGRTTTRSLKRSRGLLVFKVKSLQGKEL